MLVLASNSPRRIQLLALTGLEFKIVPTHTDESLFPGEAPDCYVGRLALEKAKYVFDRMVNHTDPDLVVVAADTTVVDGMNILGKPADALEAESMLRSLRGHSHRVFTALAVVSKPDSVYSKDLCQTDVPMRQYSDGEMYEYIASGDPLDKAGAYAIQHNGFKPVEHLGGCYANVMGLPLCHLIRTLAGNGIYPATNVPVACQSTLDYSCAVFTKILNAYR